MGPFEYKFLTIIILAVIGASLIVWGAKLLRRAYGQGRVEAEGSGFSLKIANYGPGVVIFVLGFALLIFCVTRTFKSTTIETVNTTVIENIVSPTMPLHPTAGNSTQITKITSTTTTTTNEAVAYHAKKKD